MPPSLLSSTLNTKNTVHRKFKGKKVKWKVTILQTATCYVSKACEAMPVLARTQALGTCGFFLAVFWLNFFGTQGSRQAICVQLFSKSFCLFVCFKPSLFYTGEGERSRERRTRLRWNCQPAPCHGHAQAQMALVQGVPDPHSYLRRKH